MVSAAITSILSAELKKSAKKIIFGTFFEENRLNFDTIITNFYKKFRC